MKYCIPYGSSEIEFEAPEKAVIFTGEMTNIPPIEDLEAEILRALDNPLGTAPLKELAARMGFLDDINRAGGHIVADT